MNLTMKAEPIRLPAIIATPLVVVIIPTAYAWLMDQPVRPTLAGCLLTAASYVGVGELVSRRRAVSPETHENDVAVALAAKPPPKTTTARAKRT